MDDRDENGFALVAVIWIATLLAVTASIFTAAVRSHIRGAEAEVASAEAAAAAEAGVQLAILDILNSAHSGTARRLSNGSALTCRLPSGDAITVRVRDEAGRIDLNVASVSLITALLAGTGITPEEAASRAEAVADYRDVGDLSADGRDERSVYAAAGPAAGQKNAPFAAVEELSRVAGFDGALVRRLRPFVTVHSEQDGVDPAATPPELMDILARGAHAIRDGEAEARGEWDEATIPARYRTVSARRAYGIEAEAVTGRGARFVREAVVSLAAGEARDRLPGESRGRGGDAAPTYRIWRWRRGESFAAEPAGDAPQC